MSAGASSEHKHAPSGDVQALAPLSVTTVAAYAPCPHHKGECPGCGDKVKADKPAPSRLTAALNASRAPKDLRDQIEDLLNLADKADRHDIVAGAAQALFARLKTCLPDSVTKPERPKRPGLWGMIIDAFAPLSVPAKDAQGVLKRALKQHWITQSCRDMGDGLPLENPSKLATTEQGKSMAKFLALLAEQLYADKRAKG
ncbi:hypothetical protein BH09PSE2_BH09PSE2_03670 [soil metagenome]